MTTFQDNAVGPAFQNDLISPARLLLLAPSEPRAPIAILSPAKRNALVACFNEAEEQAQPHAITKMGLVVNFDAAVVTGFTGITARLEEVSDNSVSFKGTNINPSGAEWSVQGTIDRITGSLGATVTWFNPKTNNLLMKMNYDLICKPL